MTPTRSPTRIRARGDDRARGRDAAVDRDEPGRPWALVLGRHLALSVVVAVVAGYPMMLLFDLISSEPRTYAESAAFVFALMQFQGIGEFIRVRRRRRFRTER